MSAPSGPGPVPAEPQRQGIVESATYDFTSQRFSASEDAQIDAAWEDFAGSILVASKRETDSRGARSVGKPQLEGKPRHLWR